MFLALGVGAWTAAIFHFMTHAFFKALLFLSAGSIIFSLHHEHNIFKMGGLRKQMPWVFWTFLIGACSLSALPLVTSGFYSKDMILSAAFGSPIGGPWLWAAGLLGAFLTALYSFRMVFIVFFGEARIQVARQPGMLMVVPLVVLATLSVVAGLIEVPFFSGNHQILSSLLNPVFARHSSMALSQPHESSGWLVVVASLMSIFGVVVSYFLYLGAPNIVGKTLSRFHGLQRFVLSGWGFDSFYDAVLVRPFLFFSKMSRNDLIDLFFDIVAWLALSISRLLSRTQTGQLRWYAAMIGAGAAVLIVLTEVL
jgi:NADH-quinone oxidoreductase subunit L